jgi:UDP-2-acetamido-2,6-beta-L-arabino-hexul-4-ose reductase
MIYNKAQAAHESMITVGITGQPGFIGTHLYNYLGLQKNIERIPCKDEFFEEEEKLDVFVQSCNVIVHLAALNRHKNPQMIYKTNITLVKQLIEACEKTTSTPHIIFASSIQEVRDNEYGKSKKIGRELFQNWAERNNACFTGFLIPNVFGPFGKPFYNSVISTFCYQLTHGETPRIHVDSELKLVYINELLEELHKAIKGVLIINLDQPSEKYNQENTKIEAPRASSRDLITKHYVSHYPQNKVSKILNLLTMFKRDYFEKGIIPDFNNTFELNLFNTFRSYILPDHFPCKYEKHADNRGIFLEIMKTNTPGQFSFSTTKPGITRGNHFHLRKIERFAVIKGKALIQLRQIGEDRVINNYLNGSEPSYVDIPIWHTHSIKNIGDEELFTLFWVNEIYDSENPDTYFEEV